MTGLQKPIRRETAVLRRERGKLRAICFEAHGAYLALRLKGTKTRVNVSYESILDLGYRMLARAAAAEKAEAKKQARKQRATP